MMYFRLLLKSGIAAVIIAAIAVVIACNSNKPVNPANAVDSAIAPVGYHILDANLSLDSIGTIVYVPLTNSYWVYTVDDEEFYAESIVAHRIMSAKEHGLDTFTFQTIINEDGEGEVICVE